MTYDHSTHPYEIQKGVIRLIEALELDSIPHMDKKGLSRVNFKEPANDYFPAKDNRTVYFMTVLPQGTDGDMKFTFTKQQRMETLKSATLNYLFTDEEPDVEYSTVTLTFFGVDRRGRTQNVPMATLVLNEEMVKDAQLLDIALDALLVEDATERDVLRIKVVGQKTVAEKGELKQVPISLTKNKAQLRHYLDLAIYENYEMTPVKMDIVRCEDTPESECCVAKNTLRIADLGLRFITYPETIDIGTCLGKCRIPNSEENDHAYVETLTGYELEEEYRGCCHPTHTEDLLIRYSPDNGYSQVTTRIKGVIIKSCACL
uniref:TGF_BETA_2 domain-containing protein n=1 Tax=Rhabditophanes sp. KR3021 TaxID=114890 RepID=A0AC35U3Y3_9BILA